MVLANLWKLAFMATKSLFKCLAEKLASQSQIWSSIAYVSLLSSIIEPLLPSTDTVTKPRLAVREDLDAAANDKKN